MLKLLSNLNLMQRVEVAISNWTTISNASYKQGNWLTLAGGLPTNGLAFPIWTESNRDDTYGWTPDAGAAVTGGTDKLTVLVGHHRAITSEVTISGISAGDPLTVDGNGKLAGGTIGTDHIVAVCESTDTDYVYLGNTYSNVVTYVTI